MSDAQKPARQQQQPPATRPKPKRELTKAEVKEQLRRRSASMDGHLDGLQQELTATGAQAQDAAEETVRQYTLAVMGGLGVAGAALGYWMVRRRKKRRAAASRSWMGEYREAVRAEVREAARRGDDPGEVAGHILEGHRPLVVREPGGSEKSLLRTVLDLAGRTLVTLAVKYAVDAASARALPSSETREVEDAGDDAAPAASAVSSPE